MTPGDFADSNLSETITSAFTATITWGDGTPSTVGMLQYNTQTKHFDVFGTHTYSAQGKYTVVISIVGPGSSKDTFDTMALVT